MMSFIRGTNTKSDARSALHWESNAGGNARGSIKSVAEVPVIWHCLSVRPVDGPLVVVSAYGSQSVCVDLLFSAHSSFTNLWHCYGVILHVYITLFCRWPHQLLLVPSNLSRALWGSPRNGQASQAASQPEGQCGLQHASESLVCDSLKHEAVLQYNCFTGRTSQKGSSSHNFPFLVLIILLPILVCHTR